MPLQSVISGKEMNISTENAQKNSLIQKNFIDFMGVKNEMYDLSEMIRMGHCEDVKCIANHCISGR